MREMNEWSGAPESVETDPAPSFLVGQDPQGRWLAVETHGMGGGLFRSKIDALHYAVFETGKRPGAIRFAGSPLELKL